MVRKEKLDLLDSQEQEGHKDLPALPALQDSLFLASQDLKALQELKGRGASLARRESQVSLVSMDQGEKKDSVFQAARVAEVFQAHRDPGAPLVLLG